MRGRAALARGGPRRLALAGLQLRARLHAAAAGGGRRVLPQVRGGLHGRRGHGQGAVARAEGPLLRRERRRLALRAGGGAPSAGT
eukprot:48443-Lingulodinium_polyedra.AAC.1